MKHFPIGFDDFAKLARKEGDGRYFYFFADKSLLIRDILDSTDDIILFTRPRRFGKTMNMSMLRYFFDIRDAERNRALFTGLKIAAPQESPDGTAVSYLPYQGQYPVIFVTFKDCAFNTFAECYRNIKELIYEIYTTHRYLLMSDGLADDQKATFQRILNKIASDEEYGVALKSLCKYLFAHYGKRAMVLIDEYDAPFQMALHKHYYDDLQPMMRTLVGGVLKGNEYLEKAILTGILRIAGAGIFSGANNVSAYTVLDERFSQYFGFTEVEVMGILSDMEEQGIVGARAKFSEVSAWYNGYHFGSSIVYNPWSTMVCFNRGFDFSSHWLSTGSDSLLHEKFLFLHDVTRLEIARLTKGELVEVRVCKDLRFDCDLNEAEHFWTLLLSAGYLKSVNTVVVGDQVRCQVAIPNREVSYAYLHLFEHWMRRIFSQSEHQILGEKLLMGDAEGFGEGFRRFLLECASVRDMRSDYIEAFYKGFLIATLGFSLGSHIELHSELESGLGYPDLMLRPRDLSNPKYQVGIIFELKRTTNREELKSKAQEGLRQIKEMRYETNFRACGMPNIVIISLAFCGKEIEYVFERLLQPVCSLTQAQLITSLRDFPPHTSGASDAFEKSPPDAGMRDATKRGFNS